MGIEGEQQAASDPTIKKIPLLAEVLRNLSDVALVELRLAERIEHPGESGRAREDILRRYVGSLLPKSFDASTGFVIDATGEVSRQVDLVVYRNDYAPRFTIGGVPIFMVESVAAVFEVKAAIDSNADLSSALENLRSVKALDRSYRGQNYVLKGGEQGPKVDRDQFDHQIFAGIVTQESLTDESFMRHWVAFLRGHDRREWPNIYVDVDSWCVIYGHPREQPGGSIDADPYAHDDCGPAVDALLIKGPQPPLAWLAGQLIDYLRVARLIDFQPRAYFSEKALVDVVAFDIEPRHAQA
jgi:hypothetical protein